MSPHQQIDEIERRECQCAVNRIHRQHGGARHFAHRCKPLPEIGRRRIEPRSVFEDLARLHQASRAKRAVSGGNALDKIG